MTPLVDVVAIEEGASLKDLWKLWQGFQYSRVPVFRHRTTWWKLQAIPTLASACRQTESDWTTVRLLWRSFALELHNALSACFAERCAALGTDAQLEGAWRCILLHAEYLEGRGHCYAMTSAQLACIHGPPDACRSCLIAPVLTQTLRLKSLSLGL